MIIEGRNPIAEALSAGRTFDKVMVQKSAEGGSARELLTKLKNHGVRLQFVEKQVLDKITEGSKHQGFVAYVGDYQYAELADLLKGDQRKLIVILDGISDPHNLGSIIRTCECCGADVVIPKNRAASVTEAVERISAGATSHVKVARVTNINDAIRTIKEHNIWVYAAETGGTTLTENNLKGNVAIVVGSEGEGVSRLTKELADGIVSIPMFGEINSLNASVAAAVVMYEVIRQNGSKQ